MACILHPSWMAYNSVGGPVPGAEVKLVDAPAANYLSTNNPPQGEIYIRGPSIFKGYYKRPDLDDEAFTSDRWFKTGDIGQWNPDGTISIIDRIKNLVKLQGGEYIALEHLESIYKSVPFVANGAVMADQQHTQPAMIVMAHPVNLPYFAKKNGLSNSEDMEELCKDQKVIDACLKEMNETGKKQGLKGMELLEAIVLTDDEWTPESGFLTAAQKLQRKTIQEHYKEALNVVYKLHK
jgi:long-chain acyl-CoA synthetase